MKKNEAPHFVEQRNAVTMEQLIKLGVQRGYANPVFWAKTILKAREARSR